MGLENIPSWMCFLICDTFEEPRKQDHSPQSQYCSTYDLGRDMLYYICGSDFKMEHDFNLREVSMYRFCALRFFKICGLRETPHLIIKNVLPSIIISSLPDAEVLRQDHHHIGSVALSELHKKLALWSLLWSWVHKYSPNWFMNKQEILITNKNIMILSI